MLKQQWHGSRPRFETQADIERQERSADRIVAHLRRTRGFNYTRSPHIPGDKPCDYWITSDCPWLPCFGLEIKGRTGIAKYDTFIFTVDRLRRCREFVGDKGLMLAFCFDDAAYFRLVDPDYNPRIEYAKRIQNRYGIIDDDDVHHFPKRQLEKIAVATGYMGSPISI